LWEKGDEPDLWDFWGLRVQRVEMVVWRRQ